MKKLLLILTLFFLFSCKKEEQKPPISTETKKEIGVKDSTKTEIPQSKKEIKYSISIETIDSIQFLNNQKISPKSKAIEGIKDFATAKKMLKGIVEFNDGDKDGGNTAVRRIHFRNGKKYVNENDYDGVYFVAYYPTEDILLCEGGHTTDVSFNLKNGKETEETGNPDFIIQSPKNTVRLNGNYDGQECCGYFIQKKLNGEFQKIIPLEKEFEKKMKFMLCNVRNGFWQDEKTLFVEKFDYAEDGKKSKFFKIKIIEN